MSSRFSRVLSTLGCVALAATAMLHASAFPEAVGAADAPIAPPVVSTFLQPLWLLPTVNWLLIAIATAFLIARDVSRYRAAIIFLGLIPIADAIVIFAFVGPFIGGIALLLAGTLIVAGAARPMPANRSA